MSKKCPRCGSYNTDPITLGKVGNAAYEVGKFAIAAGAAIITAPFFGHHASHVGHSLHENMRNSHGDCAETKCNHCGYKWYFVQYLFYIFFCYHMIELYIDHPLIQTRIDWIQTFVESLY